MKRLLTLLALVLCSCAETFVGEEIARPNNENLPDLTASFAEEDNTRTYIEDGKYLRWNEDDRLTAFYGNTLNRQYKFNGATGDNSGTFSLVPDGMLGTGNTFDHIYALYPYNADARISDDGVISLTLPAVQNYAENSFGRGANTMIAVTENLEDTFLSFKNACGYLKLKLYNAEGATIKSIEVKGNNGERLAGAATATIAFGEAPVLAIADDATTSVILDCSEGVALGTTAETATEFWVTLPATTFAEGLTITATDTEGGVFEKSTTNEVIIKRNAIQPMAELEAKFVATKPANNEIWYTNGSTTEATTPNRTYVFGANIVSNTYDAAKECWVIKFDGKVTTIGERAFGYCKSLTSVTIPDSVITIGGSAFFDCDGLTEFIISDSVTTIGNRAFEGCNSLTRVTIPDSVTTIGGSAFYGCSSLTSVTIPDSVTTIGYEAFSCCVSLTSVTIGDSVTTIGEEAFCWCESLTSVTIPDSVTTIGNYAFEGCSSLTSVTIPDSVTTIGKRAFRGCSSLTSVTIGDSVTTIGEEAFYNCGSLTSITIPDSVTTIGDYAFYYCSSLTSVTIGDSVTTIEDYAFQGCTSLTSVTIPDSVTAIGYRAFYGCRSLTSVTIPDSVTKIENEAFYGCSSLTSVTIGDRVTTIGKEAFYGCSSLESVTIGDSVTTIGDVAFYNCSSLTSVTIPDSVTTIGNNAFKNCSSLTSITIPESVTKIGWYAFEYCSSLTSVTIPDSVTSIGQEAFEYCRSLTSVYCKATTPPAGGSYMFANNASGRKIYVPMGSVEAYKSAQGWSVYADDIVGYDFENGVAVIPKPANNEIWYTNGSTTEATTPFYTDVFGANIVSNTYDAEKECWVIKFDGKVTTIGDNAFFDCSSLTSVTIPDSVTTIGDYAFSSCESLTSVTIPDSVTSIGKSAFIYCSSLTSVTIPDSVNWIGEYAVYGCSNLTSVYCKATTPPAGGYLMFYNNASDRKIYVPMESVEAYKSASRWSEYADAIEGYNF